MFSVNRLLWLKQEQKLLTLTIPLDCERFKKKFESLQTKISKIAVLDELLAGNCVYKSNMYPNYWICMQAC